MGVPRVFGWMEKRFKSRKIITNVPHCKIDNFYIDANCLFHPMCFTVLGFFPNWTDKNRLEKIMMERIVNYLDYIIDKVSPKNKIFLSVDGSAPQAKSAQQRYRRYRSIDDALLRESILAKHNVPVPKRWLNTVITPGTEFMEILHNKLIEYCKDLKKKKNIDVIYSSYHTPGEGEHKILDDIRRIEDSKISCCVYGLDADLLFLSMASQRKNMYLLRESTEFGRPKTRIDYINDDPAKDVAQELLYVSIDNLRKGIYESMSADIKNCKFTEAELCNDFTFFCYLMGNDFVPHIPSLDISTGGLDLVFSGYIDCVNRLKKTLVNYDDMTIDFIFLDELCRFLEVKEDYYFTTIFPKYKDKIKKRLCPFNEPHKEELWRWENMIDREYDDPVKLGTDGREAYKKRYYEHYFSTSDPESIDKICFEYIRSLKWILMYYFNRCPSYEWKYPYLVSPFVSDLYRYLNKTDIKDEDLTFVKGEFLSPCQQLLSVIPPSCAYLLPKTYADLPVSEKSPIIEFFPIKTELDTINKLINFKCYPKIPLIDTTKVREATNRLKLSEEEQKRDTVYEELRF